MWEKENSIGAAQLQAEGLAGVYNIAKVIAELASEMAQRDIKVEDLIIQSGKNTLSPDMSEKDAKQFELDIRDVFMDPESKKAFRVFMEDPDGNRTLLFESKEGKIQPDLYDLRRSMMQFYAKQDAEAFGQNADPYFDEVVIKTGKAEDLQEQPGLNGLPPGIDPSDATVDVASHTDFSVDEPIAQTAQQTDLLPGIDPNDTIVDVSAQPATYTHAEPIANADLQNRSNPDSMPEYSSQSQASTLEAERQTQLQYEQITGDSQTLRERNEAAILAAIAPTMAEANPGITERLDEAGELANQYSTVEGIPNIDEFLSEVRDVGQQITELQEQMNHSIEGSSALALSGAGDLEGWGEEIQNTLAQGVPSIGERLQAMAQQLVQFIKDKAILDIGVLQDAIANKFNETMESISDGVSEAADNLQRWAMGSNEIDDAIVALAQEFGEDGVLEGELYILDASDRSVSRREDGEVLYKNGLISPFATQEAKQAIKDIPHIAQEQAQQASESSGASMKR